MHQEREKGEIFIWQLSGTGCVMLETLHFDVPVDQQLNRATLA